jgi:hypothetical protein
VTDDRKSRPAYWVADTKWQQLNKEKIRALKAVWDGCANESQQIMAITFIMDDLCDRGSNQYYQSDRDTSFALGKKFIGDHIAGAINAKLGKIQEAKK